MTRPWQAPVTWFALFNLLAAPFIGRAIWSVMQQLNAEQAIMMAVGMALAGTIGILAVNCGLTYWATRCDLPRKGQMAMWLVTGGTFAGAIGFGVFSPINLILALLRSAVG